MSEIGIKMPRMHLRYNNTTTTRAFKTGTVLSTEVTEGLWYNANYGGYGSITPSLVDNGLKLTNGDGTYKMATFFGGYVKPLVSVNNFQETLIRVQFIMAASGIANVGFCAGMYSNSYQHTPRFAVGIKLDQNKTALCITDQATGIGDEKVFQLNAATGESERLYLSPAYGSYDVSLFNTYELKLYIMQPNLEDGGYTKVRMETLINGAIMDQSEFISDEVNDYIGLILDGVRPFIHIQQSNWVNLYFVGVAR